MTHGGKAFRCDILHAVKNGDRTQKHLLEQEQHVDQLWIHKLLEGTSVFFCFQLQL